MPVTDYFLSANPAPPWSFYPVGLPAFGGVAVLLVLLTLWTYLGRPQATGRRLLLVLGLRLLALVVALLTAVRPSVGVQEDPKLPSTLVIGVDVSQSMAVPDELGNQPRAVAVRRALEKCQPILDELKSEQNVETVVYAVGSPEFSEASKYDPAAGATLPRSDYGSYLQRSFERWQAERFVRAHLLVGDGQENGSRTPAEVEAGRWRKAGRPLSTFAVGSTASGDFKDVALVSAVPDTGSADGSVFVKTRFTLKVVADARGFVDATVPVIVSFDTGDGYKKEDEQRVQLRREKGNEISVLLAAPDRPGEIKVKVEIPVASVPGDVSPANNVIETYLTVTKEGMRVLLVGRANFETTFVRRALQGDRRIDLFELPLQPGRPPTAEEREAFDFDRQGYDVVILGNAAPAELLAIDPRLPEKLATQVRDKGMGLLVVAGPAGFPPTAAQPWAAVPAFADLLPVDLTGSGAWPPSIYTDERLQYLPTAAQADGYLNRLADGTPESLKQWERLNTPPPANRARFGGLGRVGRAKPTATVYAVATADRPVRPSGDPGKLAPALVGHSLGVGDRGRVLVLAAQETNFWTVLNKAADGPPLFARYWRQLVRYLAHQEEDDGAAFARPDWRRGPAGSRQTVRIGLRAPGGVPAVNPQFDLKIVPPGVNPATVQKSQYAPDDEPGRFKVAYDPTAPGEYTVTLSASGSDAAGKPVRGEATARFLAYADVSDEQVKTAADHDVLRRLAAAGGGRFYRLEDLPAFLKELKAQPAETQKPRPKYLPDWRRDHSNGFLPGWLVLFVALLGAEWGLRRAWGLV